MKTALLFPFVLSSLVTLAVPLAAADALVHFPATLDNTTLADGTALKVVAKPVWGQSSHGNICHVRSGWMHVGGRNWKSPIGGAPRACRTHRLPFALSDL